MKAKITLQERLKDLRIEKGLSLKQLESETGISSSALGEYEIDESKGIPHYVIVQLADYYGVSLNYLFDKSEVRNNTNTEISEINLDDKAIDLLKSKTINNRLLSEMMCHPEFKKLMADIEIFVDGVASQNIQSINAISDTLRKKIIREFNPGDDDPGLLVLNASIIEEERYFLNKLQTDLEPIVKDIRAAHMGDKESATDSTITDKVNELFEDIKKEDSNFIDILTGTFCKEIGFNVKNLSEQELEMLHSLFERSKRYKEFIKNKKNSKKRK